MAGYRDSADPPMPKTSLSTGERQLQAEQQSMVLVTCPAPPCGSRIMVPPDAPLVVCGVCGLQFPVVTQIPGSKAAVHITAQTPTRPRWDNTILGRSTASVASPIPTAAQAPASSGWGCAAAGLPSTAQPSLAEPGWPARPGNSMPPSYEQSEADIMHAASVRPAPAAAAPARPPVHDASIHGPPPEAPSSTGVTRYQPPPGAIQIELEQTGSLPLGLELAFIKAGPGASLTAVICHIQPGSIAAFTKQLQVGDMLEAINEIAVAALTKEEASAHLDASSVKLVLTRDD